MKRKLISIDELKKYISSEDEIVFMDSSPTPDIKFPPRTIAFAIHGNWTVSGVQGTAYAIRYDSNDKVLLNIDDYGFRGQLSEEESIEIVGPLKTEHHHVDELPSFLRTKAHDRVLNRIEAIRQGNLTDSNFL